MSDNAGTAEQRRYFRHDVEKTCVLRYGETTSSCRMINASLGGALLAMSDLPPVGATVVLEMEHMGTIQGTVVRQGSGMTAIRFDPDQAKAVGVNDMITFVLNQDLLEAAPS